MTRSIFLAGCSQINQRSMVLVKDVPSISNSNGCLFLIHATLNVQGLNKKLNL